VGAQFALKKISDYVMAPPPQAEEVEEEAPAAPQAAPVYADLDGQVITDEDGKRIGIARRVSSVALYLVADSRAGIENQLRATVDDPNHEVRFQLTEDGRLAGLIYVPDPSNRPAPVSASRADDI
jgi:hypothetical protein